MKPDISLIFYQELIGTFSNLLNYNTEINKISKITKQDIKDEKFLKCVLDFSFSDNNAFLNIYIPESKIALLEYHMVNGVVEQKYEIDYESQKIVFSLIESYAQNVVAGVINNHDEIPSFNVLTNIFNMQKVQNLIFNDNFYCFELALLGDVANIYFEFSDNLFSYTDMIKNGMDLAKESSKIIRKHQDSGGVDVLSAKSPVSLYDLIGEETKVNLGLLFDVKLKLSVILGSKVFLLRDIVEWDMGHVIELDQMADEPLDILVNNIYVGSGEAIVVDGKFGIKINYIGKKIIT
jgi:flagellar motor switch protein FliN/FliY